MTRFAALASLALCRVVLAQSGTTLDDVASTTVLGGINPSDIESLPTPTILGPPVGDVQSITAVSYDAASVTSAVLSQVLTATVATDISVTLDDSTATATDAVAVATSTDSVDVSKRYMGRRALYRRANLTYPIDTSDMAAPNGYTPAFESLQGATQGSGYLTYKTLTSYNTTACAAACNKISSCVFFNIYYEKDPDSNYNPVDVIKCSMYSMFQSNTTATNVGQYRNSFHVIITGSNGYNKAAAAVAPAGYTIENYNDGAVNAPLRDSAGQWRFINPVYLDQYDPALCAAACDAKTVFDKKYFDDGCNFHACTYANLYILSEDGAPKTVVCALYTEAVNSTYAVNYGYSVENPYHYYQVSNSIGLTNTTAASLYPKDPQTCAISSSFHLQVPTTAGTSYDGVYISALNNTGYGQFSTSTSSSSAATFSLDASGYLNSGSSQLFQAALPGIQLVESAPSTSFLSSMSQLVCKGTFVDLSCSTTGNTVFQICKISGSTFLAFSGETDTYSGCTAIGSTLTVVSA